MLKIDIFERSINHALTSRKLWWWFMANESYREDIKFLQTLLNIHFLKEHGSRRDF